jgi:photosystem II stability/assembly factor-like uncharacterized protein
MSGLWRSTAAVRVWFAFATLCLAAGSWRTLQLPETPRVVNRLFFRGTIYGWASGSFGGVLRTTDGGKNWTKINSNLPDQSISALSFIDANNGWAVATSRSGSGQQTARVVSTSDAGVTWSLMWAQDRAVFSDVWFTDRDHGWIAGSKIGNSLIFGTSDGGRHWNVQLEDESVPELRRVRFINAKTGWAIGPKAIFHTKDGGVSWVRQYSGPGGVWLNAIEILSPSEAWAAGGWGFLLHTTDGGAHWNGIDLPGGREHFIWGLAFGDPQHGWICGAKGLVFSTTSAGKNWRQEPTAVNEVLTDIFVTQSAVFVTGIRSRLLVSDR